MAGKKQKSFLKAMTEPIILSVGDYIALVNQTLEYSYSSVVVEGEVVNFKVNKNQWVFFDLKDAVGSLSCFMTVYQLRQPVEDGMKLRVVATPKITQWGKFSLTVKSYSLSGEGDIKKSFEILKNKLEKEGLFSPERKRALPEMPSKIGVISSTQAAGYADFVKIISGLWGGLELVVADVNVQGQSAPDQMIRAINYFNNMPELCEILVIIRGGGSSDDLSCFNDEPLVRAISASRIPVITGIGHETDTSLADLVADVRAATPSNCAQIIVPDRKVILERATNCEISMLDIMQEKSQSQRDEIYNILDNCLLKIEGNLERKKSSLHELGSILKQLDPKKVLSLGYSLVRDSNGAIIRDNLPNIGDELMIETKKFVITTGVKNAKQKAI
jgi:exodeoxyribonuclease VII large subunit